MPGITIDQRIMCGKPVIAGTRITVEHVLREIANGMSVAQVAQAYMLDEELVRLAVEWAADELAKNARATVG